MEEKCTHLNWTKLIYRICFNTTQPFDFIIRIIIQYHLQTWWFFAYFLSKIRVSYALGIFIILQSLRLDMQGHDWSIKEGKAKNAKSFHWQFKWKRISQITFQMTSLIILTTLTCQFKLIKNLMSITMIHVVFYCKLVCL